MTRLPARTWRRVVAAIAAVAVLVLVFVLRPGDDAEDAPAPDEGPSTSAAVVTDEEFCVGWKELAVAQGGFAADPDGGADALRVAADDLLALGVPEQMSPLARAGYLRVMDGVYESLGLRLDPARVEGAGGGEPLEGADAAFAGYLAESCPA